jgi:GPH family glycoside/pentoside/hexuronide:cation symporter
LSENNKQLPIDEFENSYKEPSVLNMLSYGSSGFWSMFAWSVFGAYFFFFYEVAVGLSTLFIALAMIIFTIWDAINDPLIGFLTDRTTKFTKKLGKRFPWILIGILPANFVFALLFMPPLGADPLLLFWWIVITTCAFDSLVTLCMVNVSGLFPDKFRTDKTRRKASGYGAPLSMLALPASAVIPPLIITFENPASYIPMAWVCVGLLTIVSLLFLPGMIENKDMIERYYISEKKQVNFISELKSSLKQKSFVYYLILFSGFLILTSLLTASIPYAVFFVLGGDEFDAILLFAFYLTGTIISVPFWVILANKIKNNKKSAVIGGFSCSIGTFITAFYVGLLDSLVLIFILGFSMGNLWVLIPVYFSDVLDERAVITHSDIRGTTVGVQNFFSRLSRGLQIAIIAVVHVLTGFVEGASTQSELAKLGVRLHMSVIPAIILALCTFIYWKKYPLNPEAMINIKKQLKDLGF